MRAVHSAIIALTFCNTVAASGYSDTAHEAIWQIRLAAQRHAESRSGELCAWKPESPTSFADDLIADEQAGNLALLRIVIKLIRHDQNARAVHDAFKGDAAAAKTAGDRLKAVDKANLVVLRAYFDGNDFPGLDDIGEGGAHALLLLVAHADADPEFQKSIFLKMNEQVEKGNLPAMFPLILKTIRPQILGTKADPKNTPATSEVPRVAEETPRQCYERHRSKIFGEYLRAHFAVVRSQTLPDDM